MSTRTGFLFFAVATAVCVAGRLPVPIAGSPTALADVVEKSVPGVVRVVTTGPARGAKRSGEGSGVIVSADGHILTNQHVVEGAAKITVQLADDREFTARVVAADGPTDLAVLKIEASALVALPFADSARLRVGDYVLAVGNPFGVGTSVSAGIVSSLGALRRTEGDEDLIQTDAAINPGNSGGPLLNTNGEVVGINTAIVSAAGGSNGIGLAIPANVARRVMTQLMTSGAVQRGYLGTGLQPMSPELTEAFGAPRSGGAVITDVAPGSPAEGAGLLKGDIVLALNGRAVRDFHRLRFLIAGAQPGAAVRLTIARDGSEQTVSATLAERTVSAAPVAEEVLQVAGAVLTDLNEAARQEWRVGNNVEGVLVTAVDPEGESAEAGLRPGDVIVGVNRQAVARAGQLVERVGGGLSKPALLEVSRRDGTYFVALAAR